MGLSCLDQPQSRPPYTLSAHRLHLRSDHLAMNYAAAAPSPPPALDRLPAWNPELTCIYLLCLGLSTGPAPVTNPALHTVSEDRTPACAVVTLSSQFVIACGAALVLLLPKYKNHMLKP